ncbi:hypothetical protein G3M48_004902 [Beauveria asiatica]|uniref:Uncharacterized protein n=1 Tax=Beauveria asiatica TaxID=1069075 RepID=A0AAW0S6G6_9HYPO
MPQATTITTDERTQPWKQMKEVQNLFKPDAPAANAESSQNDDEEPLKLNMFRTSLNAATTNIANVKQ